MFMLRNAFCLETPVDSSKPKSDVIPSPESFPSLPFYAPVGSVSPGHCLCLLSLTTKARLCSFHTHSWVRTPCLSLSHSSSTYVAHRGCFMFISSPGNRTWRTQGAHNILIVHMKEELISQIISRIDSNYLCKFSKGEHAFGTPSTLASSYLIKRKPTNLSKFLKLASLLETGEDKCLRRGLDQHLGIWREGLLPSPLTLYSFAPP